MKYFTTLLISVTFLVGGVSQKISYQGYVTHSDGKLVQDGNYNVKFRLFEGVEGGDALWEEDHDLYISSGLISVVLGVITPLSFSESMHFFEIEINGEVLTPRQELTTVFYAFNSESAEKASTADFATKAATADTALYSTGIPTVSYNNLSDKPTIPSGIGDLSDVDLTDVVSGKILKYDATDSRFEVGDDATGATNLSGLSDVDLTNVADGKILKYDATDSRFEVGDDATGATNLSGLSDVDLSDVADGKVLKYDATDSRFEVGDDATGATNLSGLSDVDLSDVADGKILKYSNTSSKFVVSDDATASNTSSETFSITGTSTNAGTLMIYEDTDDGTNYVGLKAGTLSSDVTWTLPTAEGSSGQVLSTDGSGTMSWSTVSSTGSSLNNATTTIGTGAADANLASSGNYDLILKTGNTTTGSITIADGADGNIAITPDGTGEVDISKVDIDGGAIDGVTIGANSSAAGTFSNLQTGSDGSDGQLTLYSEQGATDYSVVFQPNAAMTQTTTYTLPADDGTANQVLTNDGAGALSWTSTAAGDITSVGDATSGDVFTADGTGNTLYFEGTTANASEIALVGADPSADVTVTIPATTGTLYISGGTDVAVADGGTGVGTFGGTNTILYTTAADALASISSANSGVLVTSGSGVPSIATDIPTAVTIGSKYVYRAEGTDVAVADGGTGTSTGSITGTGALTLAAGGTDQNVTLTPSGTGVTVITTDATVSGGDVTIGSGTVAKAGTIVLHDADINDSFTTTIASNADVGASFTLTLPADDGTANQVLSTDGSGTLSWSTGSSLTNATTTIGTGAADANLASSGNYDLILKTGNTTTGSITIADGADGNIAITPDGTGEVDISKVDIDGGAIDGTAIGASSASAGTFTSVTASGEVTSTGSVVVSGTSTGAGTVKIYEDTDDGTNYVGLKAGTLSSDVIWTLPTAEGSSGQVLSTDGSGALSWTSTAAGDITSVGDATSGDVFTADGTGNTLYFEGTTANTSEIAVVGADPSADVTVTIPATTGTLYISGGTDVAVADGGTGVGTFGGTNTILYTTAADALASISSANNGVLVTSGSGVPSIATDIPTAVTIGSKYVYRAEGTDVAVADGGTGTSTGSIAGTGALTLAAGGTDQNVTLTPSGTGVTVITTDATVSGGDVTIGSGTVAKAGTIVLHDADVNDSFTTTIASNADVGASFTLTLPADDGTANQVLSTNGSGTLSWYNVAINDLSDGSTGGGTGNTFLGSSAGAAVESGGYSNTGLGYEALKAISTGDNNTASGYQALYSNLAGTNNTAIGNQALYSNISGNYNTAIGNLALLSNTTGYNTAIGNQALLSNTTGYNTATGYCALRSNTTGNYNTANGHSALYSNNTGFENTAIGHQALYSNTTGRYNTASGNFALFSNTTGQYNTASGHSALRSNDTGIENTASGYLALYSNISGHYNTASGYMALFSNTTAHYNTAVGMNSLYNANRTDDAYGYNTALGYRAGDVITTGQKNVIIGADSDPSAIAAVNQIVIGYGVTGTGDNEIALGNTSIQYIKAQVTTITAYSDRRIKKDIRDSDLGLAFINELRPVKYKRKNPADYPEPLLEKRFRTGQDERPEDDETVYDGLIAQEVKSTLDKLGLEWSGWTEDENTGKQGIQYGALVVPLINAVQELSAKVDELESQLNHLEETDGDISASESTGQ